MGEGVDEVVALCFRVRRTEYRMIDCGFCDIAAGDAPAYRLYGDERTVDCLDDAPADPPARSSSREPTARP